MHRFETEKPLEGPARIEALINVAFKREVIRKVTDVIAPLNDFSCSLPLYCVHSIVGAATEFQHMARLLGSKQKFYGIQVPTERRNAEFGRSIRELGRYYADELVRFQPEGIFLLAGYSIGATIALEVSQQLIARGREVGLLAVFDGELFNTGAEMSPLNPIYGLKLLRNVPRWIVDELIKNRQRFATKMAARLKPAASKTPGKNWHRPHAVEQFVNLDGLSPDHAAFVKALYESHLDYVPTRYPGRVLVFVAKTQALLRLRQVKAAWAKVAPSSEICEVAGTHLSIMKMSHGPPVAKRLSEAIAEIGDRSASSSCRSPSPAGQDLAKA